MKKSSRRNWDHIAANILKNELKRQKITYEDLCKCLTKIRVDETIASVSNKINRGTFSFSFFIQCMKAIASPQFHFDTERTKTRIRGQSSFLLGLLIEHVQTLTEDEKELLTSLLSPPIGFHNFSKNKKSRQTKGKSILSFLLDILAALKSSITPY